MNPLFVTDLDGTLLTPQKTLSEKTVTLLNSLLDRGMLFSVATARSPATAVSILSELHLSLPVILLGGVFLYDLKGRKYLDCEVIPSETAQTVLEIMERAGRMPFLYSMEDELCVEFKQLYNAEEEKFYRERVGKAYKRFIKREHLEAPAEKKVVFFSMQDRRERLLPIVKEIKKIKGLGSAFYRDNYSENYFLEIFSFSASKRAGVEKLKALCGADYVVAFGDNANDVDMLSSADEGYAVRNGTEEAKGAANGLIASNEEDGVAEFLIKWHDRIQAKK